MYLPVKDQFKRHISKGFDPKIKLDQRLSVIADTEMFRVKEDPFVWGQHKGKLPVNYMVYFDDQHICTFDETMSTKHASLLFWRGFKQAYQAGKVRLRPIVDEPVVDVTKEQLRVLDQQDASTKERKIAKDIVKRVIKNER